MSRIYSNTNKIQFTDISDKYKVNRAMKGSLSKLHAVLITYVVDHFRDSKKYKQQVVDALNFITYAIYADEPLPFNWSPSAPFATLPEMDKELIETTLGDIFLTIEAIIWDVKPSEFSQDIEVPETSIKKMGRMTTPPSTVSSSNPSNVSSVRANSAIFTPKSNEVLSKTSKQDLYIQSPTVPQFDYSRPWIQGKSGSDVLVIYTTLPEIPTKQNEISVTTDVSKMHYNELMCLYPDTNIHTRAPIMYRPIDGVAFDEEIGLILPIEGFTEAQVLDNIIKYPHIFRLLRVVDDEYCSFYSQVEMNGELKNTLEIWDSLPESKILPRQADFVKEYVVRRYLLERDISKKKHIYPLFGTFEPFLTLFMPSDNYIRRGYTDTESIVKQCVLSRVSYKQSRNPVIRRLQNA